MKNMKRFFALFTVAAMSLSFVACNDMKKNKELTADEVLDSVQSLEDTESGTIKIEMVADLDMDFKQMLLDQGITEEEMEEALENGDITEEYFDAAIVVDMNLEVNATNDYSYIKGDLSLEAMGEKEKVNIENYTDYTDKDTVVTYQYDEDADEWYCTEEDVEEASTEELSELLSSFTDYIKEAEVVDVEDDIYTLDITLDVEKLYEEAEDTIDEMLDESGDAIAIGFGDISDIVTAIEEMDITITVDNENHYLTGIEMDLTDLLNDVIAEIPSEEDDVDYSKYISVNEFSINVEVTDIEDTEVEIPEDVIENAVSMDDFFGGDIDIDFDDEDEDIDFDDEDEDIDFDDEDEDIDFDDEDDDIDFDDEDEDVDTDDDDEDGVVVTDNTVEIWDYSDNILGKVSIPEGYVVDQEYSENQLVFLESENNSLSSIDISCYPSMWVTDLMEGKEPETDDSDLYTREEFEEIDSVETEQGTIRVFVRTWSMEENPEEDYYELVQAVLEDKSDNGYMINAEFYVDEIEDDGYTIETLVKAIFK